MNAPIEKREEFATDDDGIACTTPLSSRLATNSNFHRGDARAKHKKVTRSTKHTKKKQHLRGETENHRRMVFPLYVFLHNGDMRSGLVLLPLQLSVNFSKF